MCMGSRSTSYVHCLVWIFLPLSFLPEAAPLKLYFLFAQLQRHGARFPTTDATARILAGVRKIQSAKEYKDPHLNFLESFEYDLGENNLTPFGERE